MKINKLIVSTPQGEQRADYRAYSRCMQSTLQQHSNRAELTFFKRIKREWDAGRMSLEPSHFIKRATR